MSLMWWWSDIPKYTSYQLTNCTSLYNIAYYKSYCYVRSLIYLSLTLEVSVCSLHSLVSSISLTSADHLVDMFSHYVRSSND